MRRYLWWSLAGFVAWVAFRAYNTWRGVQSSGRAPDMTTVLLEAAYLKPPGSAMGVPASRTAVNQSATPAKTAVVASFNSGQFAQRNYTLG